MNIALPDYHIHTHFCKHATGEMKDYVEQAIEIGLEEIGFSDHMPVMPEPQFCMGYDDLSEYIQSVRGLQKRYDGQIVIKLGCEMDIVPDRLDEIKRIIDENEFDYVIGSIHYLDGWPFDQEKYRDVFLEKSVYDIYERFFDAIIAAAQTGLYDIAGHIDNIKRMGYRPKESLTGLYRRVAEVLQSMDCAVEINTSGFDTDANEAYPSPEFLSILRQFNIPVTIGSDAHYPINVGRNFSAAARCLERAGYDSVAYFSGRKRTLKSLIPATPENGGSGE